MITMIKDNSDSSNNNLKVKLLYVALLISNIILFVGLIQYNAISGVKFHLETYEYFSSVIPTIIILGFISTKLGKLREKDSSLYEMGYLIIITVLSLLTAYFSDKANTAEIFGSYLEMFRMLCIILIFILMTIRLKQFKEIMQGKFTKKNIFTCFIIFAILGILSTQFNRDVGGTPANVRCMVVMISGLFGGPLVGIPVGLISGAFRFTAGGTTAVPCAISTVISGIIGSLVFIWNDKKFPRPLESVVLMFLFTGFEMLLVVLLTPSDISFPYVRSIYPLMLFASVIGMVLFSIVIRDKTEELNSPDGIEHDELKEEIDELKEELEETDEIKELKREIQWLKNEIKSWKKD